MLRMVSIRMRSSGRLSFASSEGRFPSVMNDRNSESRRCRERAERNDAGESSPPVH